MSLLLLLTLAPAFAQTQVRLALPDQATYQLAFSTSESAVPPNPKLFRKVQASGTVSVARKEGGYKLTVAFNKHYEAVDGLPQGSDLKGVTLTYHLTSDGKVSSIEGEDEFLIRTTADLQRQAPTAAAQIRHRQLVYLRHNCDWIASAIIGRPLQSGLEWEQTLPAGGHPLALRPVSAKLKSNGTVKCGLGECIEIEGTFQDNITEEKLAILEGAAQSAPPAARTISAANVQSAWDSGLFRLQVHTQTGMIAKMSRYITSVIDMKSGPVTAGPKQQRSLTTEILLTDETLPKPKPIRPTIIGSGQ